MRLHRFFIQEAIPDVGEVIMLKDRALTHQLSHVFRLKSDDQIILLDNSGYEYVCSIISHEKNATACKVLERRENTVKPTRDLWLYASMIKKDNFEWVLEKGTELGVSHFVPIVSERSEKKDFNIERGMTIIKEAAEQSGRGRLPELSGVTTFAEALEGLSMPAVAFHLEDGKFDVAAFSKEKSLAVFIGPEGGWTDRELELFKEKKIPIVHLDFPVLRAETAAIAVVTLLLL